jgi:tRNA U54 and U55 pseudouridine synthase Pus10
MSWLDLLHSLNFCWLQALCWSDQPLGPEQVELLLAVQDLEVMQDTPIRVLHRRASKVRVGLLCVCHSIQDR